MRMLLLQHHSFFSAKKHFPPPRLLRQEKFFHKKSKPSARKKLPPASPTTAAASKSKVDNDAVSKTTILQEDTRTLWQRTLLRRFHHFYDYQRILELAKRLPAWIAIVACLSWDETSPYSLIQIRGPSMLPTMSADGSEIWLRSTWCWQRHLGFNPSLKKGDLVGFTHPLDPHHRVSCKRVIGVERDRVPRYGQYAPLYLQQDPENLGLRWPTEDDPRPWMDRSMSWDQKNEKNSRREDEARRTLVVPHGHVWLEADCPALGIDSRHLGPIPVEWLQGRIVARLWPLWRSSGSSSGSLTQNHAKRPHPIPLDDETLKQYNVHRKG